MDGWPRRLPWLYGVGRTKPEKMKEAVKERMKKMAGREETRWEQRMEGGR
jgi:hypothetical protein